MERLCEKNILFFCERFFGYEERIAKKLRQMGNRVDFFDERPANSFLAKAFIRLAFPPYRPLLERYYRKILQRCKGGKYDYVFVIKNEVVTEKALKQMRELFPKAKFVLYLWDSVANTKGVERKLKYYDRVLSFDPEDCVNYGLIFRPMFFDNEGKTETEEEVADSFCYDISFVGTAHTVRPRLVRELKKQCEAFSLYSYFYLYSPHRLVHLWNNLTDADYRGTKASEVHFKPLPPEEVAEVYRRSKSVLDIKQRPQKGLAIRPIELLGLQRKLITTDADCPKYDFYHPDNIAIIDAEKPLLPLQFIQTLYKPLEPEIREKFTLEYFLAEVFGTEQNSTLGETRKAQDALGKMQQNLEDA